MIREKVLEILESVKGDIQDDVRKVIREMVALAEPYRYLGKGYTFSADSALDDRVNRMLVELSDLIQEEMRDYAYSTIDDIDDDKRGVAMAFISRDEVVKAFDNHCSHIKFIAEGWLAIGFANKLTGTEMLSNIMVSLLSPFTAPEWRRAMVDDGYVSQIFSPMAGHWGRGVQRAPIDGLTLAGRGMINEAYQMGTIMSYEGTGAIGYKIHRGSTFPCPVCDDLTIGVHPLGEVLLPAHPRCVCWTSPVFKEE